MKIKITRSMIEQGLSRNGGYNNQQILALGTKIEKGWLSKLVGQEIEKEKFDLFLSLKDVTLNDKKVYNSDKGKMVFEPVKELPWREQYLHPNWQRKRLLILKRDRFTCIDCKDKNKTLHVHHLKYLRGKMIWEVPDFYLVTLCEDCHSKEHDRDLRAKKTY